MAGARTLGQFQDALDREMGWRVKEIGVFNVASRQTGSGRKSFIRAGVALTYAHWEGFIKKSSETYVNYVGSKKLSNRDLKSCFAVLGLKGRLNAISGSNKSSLNIGAYEFILSELDSVSKLDSGFSINTESNLSSKVFCNIATSLDIDISAYDTKFNFIDKSLVDRRNAIAHGEYMDLTGPEFGALVEEVLSLMRQYKTDLQNAASLETYRRSTA
jgi:hypothetical protein